MEWYDEVPAEGRGGSWMVVVQGVAALLMLAWLVSMTMWYDDRVDELESQVSEYRLQVEDYRSRNAAQAEMISCMREELYG